MLVRQPISHVARILLGVVAIALLILSYTWLAQSRQHSKRADAQQRLADLDAELNDLNAEFNFGGDAESSGSVPADAERRYERIQRQRKSLREQTQSAVDRSVPTWSSLYHDGLLRVLQPQGLKKDEYWLWEDAWATGTRLVAGMLVGMVLSIILGVVMGAYTPVESFFGPTLSFLAKIPPTAMLVVFFVLVGTSFKMYVTMIAFGTLPTMAQTVFQTARKDVSESLVFKAYTLGASHGELIWNVIFKQILPRIIDAVRLQIGPAMVLLVAAEWMVAGEGFGYRLRLFYQRTDMTVVYLYLVLLGAAGLTVDYALIWLRRRLCPWFDD